METQRYSILYSSKTGNTKKLAETAAYGHFGRTDVDP